MAAHGIVTLLITHSLYSKFHLSLVARTYEYPETPVPTTRQAVIPQDPTGTAASMFVFGGVSKDMVLLNDVWKLDLKTFVWTDVRCGGTEPKKYIR